MPLIDEVPFPVRSAFARRAEYLPALVERLGLEKMRRSPIPDGRASLRRYDAYG